MFKNFVEKNSIQKINFIKYYKFNWQFYYYVSKIIKFFLVIFILNYYLNPALAQQESKSPREAVISSFNKRFYQSNRVRQYLAFAGSYNSDYNSKSYQLNSRYLFQNPNYTHEISVLHEVDYADTGSGKTKKYDVKKTELYDLTASSKARLGESANYGVFYHRSLYDKFSNLLYDHRTAIGLGRAFNNEKIELDFSLAYRDVKADTFEIDYLSSLRLTHKFSSKISMIQRSYIFFGKSLYDEEYRTSLVYRLNNKVSLELRHNFEKRRYSDFPKRVNVNQISRGVTFGMVFDLFN